MKKICAIVVIGFTLIVGLPCCVLAQCRGDLNKDGDVDAGDVSILATNFGRMDCTAEAPCPGDIYPQDSPDGTVNSFDLSILAQGLGETDCPVLTPLNLFNIGDSIGEGQPTYENPYDNLYHETVWSTGYDGNDDVSSLNERFEAVDPFYWLWIAKRDTSGCPLQLLSQSLKANGQ